MQEHFLAAREWQAPAVNTDTLSLHLRSIPTNLQKSNILLPFVLFSLSVSAAAKCFTVLESTANKRKLHSPALEAATYMASI